MGTNSNGGTAIGAGATGNLAGFGATPTGFTMPGGSNNMLFSLPNGNVATPGDVQMNPFSMGMGTMQGVTPDSAGGLPTPSLASLLGAAKGASQGGAASPHGGGAAYRGGGAVDFMPSSAISLLKQGVSGMPSAGQISANSLLQKLIGGK